ncbi:MAG: cytochrome c oxidase subunit II [Alphaproteobacteria bacterium]
MVLLTGYFRRRTPGSALRTCLITGLSAILLAGLPALGWAAEPYNWQLGMQPPATPVQAAIDGLHNLLLIIIFAISAFVLALLLYVIVRFRASRNPVPTRTAHNTVIEVLWTVVPVLILVIIAIPSFRLMYFMDRVPEAEMTVRVVGNQWFWTYSYPDQGDFSFASNLIQASDLKPGDKRLLDVDNPLVVPIDTNIRVLVTGVDVMHSWFIPSFGIQFYAYPGRVNETWMRVENPGTFYGQCNQICGINHAYMPIKVVAVSKPEFERWLVEARQRFAAGAPAGEETQPTTVAAAAAAAN